MGKQGGGGGLAGLRVGDGRGGKVGVGGPWRRAEPDSDQDIA